jgi:hypothetical protein
MRIGKLSIGLVLAVSLCFGLSSCKAENKGNANDVQPDSVAVNADSQYVIQYEDDPFYKFLCSLPRKKRIAEIKNYKGEDKDGLYAVAFGMPVPPDWEQQGSAK